MAGIERIVVVTKKTAQENLVYRLNSKAQARFYLEQNKVSYSEYEQADTQYQQAVQAIKRKLPHTLKLQFIDRDFLPTYQFSEHDLVITLGPDGLVINTAKYLTTQPLLAVNPDPTRIDGILIPFHVDEMARWVEHVVRGEARVKEVSMVRATLNDGQELYAVNDLFIGQRGHGSARYQLALGDKREQQSSSGIIVSTGAGCTGWLRSITLGAWHIAHYFDGVPAQPPALDQISLGWESTNLWFTVREPFVSRTTQATLVFGQILTGEELIITSQMPDNGIIFGDGIENDYLAFNSGAIAHVALAEQKAHLVARN